MRAVIKKILKRYQEEPFTLQLKSGFLFYTYLLVLFSILAATIYTVYANLNNPLRNYSINYSLLTFFIIFFLFTLLGLYFHIRGYYSLAAHLILIFVLALIWMIIYADETHIVSRLDTIVLVVAGLSILPIVVSRKPKIIILYAGINILILLLFTLQFQDTLKLPKASIISYLADNSVAIIVVSIISYQVYSINKRALEKAEKDIAERIAAEKELKEHKDNLELLVEEKSRDLKMMNDELKTINKDLFSKNEIIKEQNEELQHTLQNLKEMQAKLVQAEKMASLGILTSGVAHEINNPLNFIMGAYEGINLNREQSLDCKKNEQCGKLLNVLKTGIDRTSAIVKSLNQFSRGTKQHNEQCMIHEIIDNTIIMLNNKCKNRIAIIKHYSNESLQVQGNVGELHQVFLNIFTNAIDALSEKGEIRIITLINDNNIIIEISDNGEGISKENLKRITDPFFTTKEPGKGIHVNFRLNN
jgi:signal transduction histidine kinase